MRRVKLVALAVGVALAAAGCGGGPVARVATAGGPSTAGRLSTTTGSTGATPFATFTASPIIVHPPVASPTSGTGASAAGNGTATAATATTGGASSGGAPGSSGSPTPTLTPSSGTVVVTTGDEGSTVVLAPGDTLVVELSGDWVAPTASDTAVLRRDSVSKSDTSARATFTARTVGRSDVDSASDAPCLHASPPCEIAQREWVVHVVVQD